jgi:hypothetical protein
MGTAGSVLHNDSSLLPIRLINFNDFCALNTFPRFPENKDIVVEADPKFIDRGNCFIVFVSHCWLRGWNGAVGWDGR